MLTTPKYKVQLCCGTMCYIMGGAELHLLIEALPDQLKDKVSIEGIPCIGKCDTNEKLHPCVLINGEELNNASTQKIIKQLLTLDNNDVL
ncbi:NAD(P)H-dependent oxidoreductase subunit E [Carboxylicivirga sediminis]|uniref:NAD(P)H-dependent oxidoreductase subunit E n=1 Tax=Carboxylicivirga sediminis TaxID=2006564 RepID=A0A941F8M5_9BACT|nr:NAD(P)H-dependent oxidoreductase subunit E [Carboxylicivirga sediminis]MBR8537185.1 NAD(P)H-dependent oxidoreductase subunit E [Carboxylicivirga sediminis]